MNDDLRTRLEPPPRPPAPREGPAVPSRSAAALPAGAFTASVLFDVLALVAESNAQALSFRRRAVELLNVGLGASLAGLGLDLVESLNIPATTPAGKRATRNLALNGAIVAVYLLNLGARQKHVADVRPGEPVGADSGPIGLSVAGLALLAASGKLRL